MTSYQRGILLPPPPVARYLTYRLQPGERPRASLHALARQTLGDELVVGIGLATVAALGATITGLREPFARSGSSASVPATPTALWLWLRGTDRGELVHRTHALHALLGESFACESVLDAFTYDGGRDLTGYEDGTENPKGDDAVTAATVACDKPGLGGGSFVAVQCWRHDLPRFASFTQRERDAIIGRRRRDNAELRAAPSSAHVKRTAQESFDPPAILLRRSMPFVDARGEGLVFVAFGRSFDAFETLLSRMLGEHDGVTDALFRFTRPVTSAYFFCPPLREGRLDLRALGS